MSQVSQTEKSRPVRAMSVDPPEPDITRPAREVRFVPGRDSCTAALFDAVSRQNGSSRLPLARARQDDLKLCEHSGLRLDINAAAVLFYDDVVAHRQAKPGTFAGRLSREEWIENFLFDPFRDAGPVVSNADPRRITGRIPSGRPCRGLAVSATCVAGY